MPKPKIWTSEGYKGFFENLKTYFFEPFFHPSADLQREPQ